MYTEIVPALAVQPVTSHRTRSNLGGLVNADNIAGATRDLAPAPKVDNRSSIIIVEIIGYGGADEFDNGGTTCECAAGIHSNGANLRQAPRKPSASCGGWVFIARGTEKANGPGAKELPSTMIAVRITHDAGCGKARAAGYSLPRGRLAPLSQWIAGRLP